MSPLAGKRVKNEYGKELTPNIYVKYGILQ